MTFEEWLESVPDELTGDPLWRMESFRLAVFTGDLAWHDVSRLIKDGRTRSLADQLYRAIGSIPLTLPRGTAVAQAETRLGSTNTLWGRPAKRVCGTIRGGMLCLKQYLNTVSNY